MILYASRTGTKRNLDALRSHGWRLMVSARGVLRHEGFAYALDNGAWTAYQRGEPFDVGAFEKALDELGSDADFIVAPDIVGAGVESLEFSIGWLGGLRDRWPEKQILLPVQDGVIRDDLWPLLSPLTGIFVGGTTAWKLATIPYWGRAASDFGCYLHIGRVNSAKRIKLAKMAGADSIDGSGVSRFSKYLHSLMPLLRQQVFSWERR